VSVGTRLSHCPPWQQVAHRSEWVREGGGRGAGWRSQGGGAGTHPAPASRGREVAHGSEYDMFVPMRVLRYYALLCFPIQSQTRLVPDAFAARPVAIPPIDLCVQLPAPP